MKVEMLVRWTEIKVSSGDPEAAKLRRLIDGEEGEQTVKYVYDYAPMTFDLTDIKSFNRSNDKSCTTIRFYEGDIMVVKVTYDQFQEIYSEAMGKRILSYLPDDWENKFKKGGVDSTSKDVDVISELDNDIPYDEDTL